MHHNFILRFGLMICLALFLGCEESAPDAGTGPGGTGAGGTGGSGGTGGVGAMGGTGGAGGTGGVGSVEARHEAELRKQQSVQKHIDLARMRREASAQGKGFVPKPHEMRQATK